SALAAAPRREAPPHEFATATAAAAAPRREAAPVASSAVPVAAPNSHLWDGEAEPAAPGGLWARKPD
ncbi:hypothetical protein OJ997_35970, partial [Solirubrobacter phytolaccae]